MAACTFFGHRDAPSDIKGRTLEVLCDLIENLGVDVFYVGNNGAFDKLVITIINELVQKYPHIKYYVVLAYHPKNVACEYNYLNTIYPEALTGICPKFAIKKRNEWMIEKSEIIVSYTKYSTGGAVFYTQLALKKGRKVINIAE